MTKRVVVENCIASGASEAGIYVGQSLDALVKNNRVENNVVGLDIENSTQVHVTGNVVRNNSLGILVSARPHLLQQRSYDVRVEGNEVEANNTPNFAAPGSHVASLKEGVGIAVVAADKTLVSGNQLRRHDRTHVLFLSFGSLGHPQPRDPHYKSYLKNAQLLENHFETDETDAPIVSARWQEVRGVDVVWDGIRAAENLRPGFVSETLCMSEPSDVRFLDTSSVGEADSAAADLNPVLEARPVKCGRRAKAK
jgi:parallel beta-helix repeat protein